MSKNHGGPAFPQQDDASGWAGMSLRDYFAAKALASTAQHFTADRESAEDCARFCYLFADAMLAERNKT
jgi:hypothetical protein